MERVGGHNEGQEARPGRSYRFLETGRGESEHTQPAGPHTADSNWQGGPDSPADRKQSPSAPLCTAGGGLLKERKKSLVLGHTWLPHWARCKVSGALDNMPGAVPRGRGGVPSPPISSPLYWLPTKKLLSFLKASEYTVPLCGVGGTGTNGRSRGQWGDRGGAC